MANGDVYRVSTLQQLHGQLVVNVHHYIQTEGGGTNTSTQLGASFGAAVIPSMKAVQSSQLSYTGIAVQKIRPLPVEDPVVNVAFNGPGAGGAQSLPTSVAVIAAKTTGLGGRANRGRSYLAGVPEGDEALSQLTGPALTAWDAAVAPLGLDIVSGLFRWKPVIYHRVTGTGTFVTDASAKAILRNQRRRQVGVGA